MFASTFIYAVEHICSST